MQNREIKDAGNQQDLRQRPKNPGVDNQGPSTKTSGDTGPYSTNAKSPAVDKSLNA